MVKKIPSLDGIRAISFLLVFIAHAGLDKWVPGGFGVTVFFFLSGFLITTLMRLEYQASGEVNLKHFYLRRILRIWPPFYIVLFVAAIAMGATFKPFLAQLLHVTNYWSIYHGVEGMPPGTGVYWSLAVEEHFYLGFPLLYLGMQKMKLSNRQQALAIYALCTVVLAWRCYLVLVAHVSTDRTYMGTDCRIDSILFGCALAIYGNPVVDGTRVRLRSIVPAVIALLACLLIRGDVFRETLRYTIQGAGLTALFVAAIQFAPHILNNAPLRFIGLLSYSLYLLHFVVIFSIEQVLPLIPHVVQMIVAFLVSVALSWLIYILVEKPAAGLRRKLQEV